MYKDTNVCESLRLCLNNVYSNNILLINALTLPKKITPIKHSHVMLYVTENNKKSDIGVNINENNKVEHMSFCAKNAWLDMMWITNKTTITSVKKILSQDSYKKKMWFELINDMISKKISIDYTMVGDDVIKIDNLRQYKN
jgi:hypothetical protein